MQIDKRSIPEQAADVILMRILAGTYMPGDRIIESHVASELGIAQSSVREALRKLELSGVVDHKRHAGVIVRTADPDDARIAVPIRAKIEEIAMVEAMRRSVDVAPLRAAVEAMRASTDFDTETAAHTDFHHYICEASGHRMLAELWDLVIWRTSALYLHGTDDDGLVAIHDAHDDIADFLELGDPSGAEQIALDHVMGIRTPVVR